MTVPPPTCASTAARLSEIGDRVNIDETARIGLTNANPEIFCTDAERITRINDDCKIGPWALLYEGARLGKEVVVDVRGLVGSKTTIGSGTRLYYGAQVHDNVEIGEQCVIAGFVADNCRIGAKCSVFGALIHRYSIPGVDKWDVTDEIGPTLGEGVLVGWGAVLIGPIHIGDGARIAPNRVVCENVEAGSYVS